MWYIANWGRGRQHSNIQGKEHKQSSKLGREKGGRWGKGGIRVALGGGEDEKGQGVELTCSMPSRKVGPPLG